MPFGWTVALSIVAALHVAASLRLLARRRAPRPLANPAPSLTVVAAFKGAAPELAAATESLLAQDYPGELSWRLVVESENDPAAAVLKAALAREPRAKLVVSGEEPSRSSAKSLRLIAGAAGVRSELLLFSDAGLFVARDWAARMAAALEPGVTAATAVALDEPRDPAASLRLAWSLAGAAWFEPMTLAAGHSLAIRRADYEALGVAELWRGAVSEDLELGARVLERGGRIVMVPGAAPESRRELGLEGTLERLDRWMTLFRFCQPLTWRLGAAAALIKLGGLVQAFQSPVCWPLAVLAVAGDVLAVGIASLAHGRGSSRAALLAPLLPLVHARNFAVSAFQREIVWAGWTYSFEPARAERGEEPARRRRSRRAGKLALSVLGGVLWGLAHYPGAWGLTAWLAFVPLLLAIDDETPSGALVWGLVFGVVCYGVGGWWGFSFLPRFLGAGPPEAAVWFLGVCVVHGARWAACAALAARAPAGPARTALFVLGAMIAEPYAPTLFPGTFAATQAFHLPSIQLMEKLGEAGPAALVLAANAALHRVVRSPGAPAFAFAAAVAVLLAGNEVWGRRRLAEVEAAAESRPVLRAGLVQGGVVRARGPNPNRFGQDLARYSRLSGEARIAGASELVVWPESTFAPLVEYDLDAPAQASADGAPLAESLRSVGARTPLLLSAIGRGPDGRERNVSVLVDAKGRGAGVTEKTVLAPFGEYVPGGRLTAWFRRLSPRTGTLSPGTGARALPLGSARLGVLICFESSVAGPAERLSSLGANVLVSQTNDSWLDGTTAPEQHMRQAVLRAIENRRAVLHAAATGVSAAISPSGRVVARIDAGAEGALAYAAPLSEEKTGGPAAARAVFGACAALLAAGAAWGGSRSAA